MSRDANPLFPDYMLYGPYVFKKHGRKMVHMVRRSDRHRMSMTWARYKMCVHLGRVLETSEEVDHVDEDPHNDDLDNLQILTRSENRSKSAGRTGCIWVRLRCPECSKVFERERRQTHIAKKGAFTACTRSCSSKFRHAYLADKHSKSVLQGIAKNVIGEFRVYDDWNRG